MGLNWLITGGCGFIGTAVVKRLTTEGNHAIRVLDNLSTGKLSDLSSFCSVKDVTDNNECIKALQPGVCHLVVGDILDKKITAQAAQDIDVVVHLAANTGVAPSVEDPRLDCMSNVVGTLNVLEAARFNGVRRFVFASSGAPVGAVLPPIHEELPPHPVSPYGASKLAGEGYCSAYFHTFEIETVVLRFSNVYGPGSQKKQSVVAKFIKSALNGQPFEIYGDGLQTRDFIYIDDLVAAIMAAAAHKTIGGEVFQIATNRETTLSELIDELRRVMEHEGLLIPTTLYKSPRLGDVKRNYSDTSKAKDLLGWLPKTDLPTGLAKTLAYFRQVNLDAVQYS